MVDPRVESVRHRSVTPNWACVLLCGVSYLPLQSETDVRRFAALSFQTHWHYKTNMSFRISRFKGYGLHFACEFYHDRFRFDVC